jgi:hypothetical protein
MISGVRRDSDSNGNVDRAERWIFYPCLGFGISLARPRPLSFDSAAMASAGWSTRDMIDRHPGASACRAPSTDAFDAISTRDAVDSTPRAAGCIAALIRCRRR